MPELPAVMAAHPQLIQARHIADWFSAHFRRTDGRFSRRFTPRYNANCVVLNVETLWEHYRFSLAKHNLVLCLPPKSFFIYVLQNHLGVEIKHVKNRYVGSVKHAALVCALEDAPCTPQSSAPVWHPACGFKPRSQAATTA